MLSFRQMLPTGLPTTLALVVCATCGCQVVIPSVRNRPEPHTSCADRADPGLLAEGEVGAEAQFVIGEAPALRPPLPKFHPVPTRPVFASSPLPDVADSETIPTPAADAPQEINPQPTDELPAPDDESAPSDSPEPDEATLDHASGAFGTILPASTAIRWVDEP